MKIKKIELNNFKRFTHLLVENIPETTKLVVLVGPNGSGKTSFMEAMNHYYKCAGYNDAGDYHYLSKAGNVEEFNYSEWRSRALKLVNIDPGKPPFRVHHNVVTVIIDLRRQGMQHGVLAAGNSGIGRHTFCTRGLCCGRSNVYDSLFHCIPPLVSDILTLILKYIQSIRRNKLNENWMVFFGEYCVYHTIVIRGNLPVFQHNSERSDACLIFGFRCHLLFSHGLHRL